MIKKIAFTAVLITLFASVTAMAEITECTVDSETDEVTVAGEAEPGAQVLLTVVRGGRAGEDLFENIGYQYQKQCGEDGSFGFTFKLNEADIYTAYASTPDTTYTYDFVFSNRDSAKDIIDRINAAASAGAIADIIRNDRYAAGLFVAECSAEPDYGYISELMAQNRPYSTDNVDAALTEFKQYLSYGYAVNGDTENIFRLESYLDIYSIPGAEIFTSDIFGEPHQLETTRRMVGKTISGRADFENTVTEQMALALIKDPDGYGNVQKVCETFASRIGIDTSNTASSVYRDLYGRDFSSFGELQTEFNRLKSSSSGTGGTGGTGGSGGSGGGGGGGGASLGNTGTSGGGTVSVTPNDPPERLPMDTADEPVFGDLAGYDWAAEAIEALYNEGIISGRAEGVYAPADNITRSEFVKLVVLAFGISDSGGRMPFTDTEEGSWDCEYIRAAYNSGIINGISADKFGCTLPISRQDMAVIIQRAAGIADVDTDTAEKFADDWSIKNYAYNAAYALKSSGIMVGDENNMFNPNNTATRAEAAKVIYAAAM